MDRHRKNIGERAMNRPNPLPGGPRLPATTAGTRTARCARCGEPLRCSEEGSITLIFQPRQKLYCHALVCRDKQACQQRQQSAQEPENGG